MTNQEKKEYLKGYKVLNQAINQKLQEYDQLKALCLKTTATLTGMPASNNPNGRENLYTRLADMKTEIDAEIDKYVDKRSDIEAKINQLSDMTLQTLLRDRYINGMTWEETAVAIGKSWRHTIRMHGEALNKIKIE